MANQRVLHSYVWIMSNIHILFSQIVFSFMVSRLLDFYRFNAGISKLFLEYILVVISVFICRNSCLGLDCHLTLIITLFCIAQGWDSIADFRLNIIILRYAI